MLLVLKQRGLPVEDPSPVITMLDPAESSVVKVTSLPLAIVKVELLFAANAPLAVVVPVTTRLPPIVSLPVTEAEFRVANPEVERVEREVAPVTPRVEERVVAPVTPRVPPTVSLPVTEAEFRVANPEVERVEREVAPVTPRVEERVVAPVTPRVPPRVVAPLPTEKVLVPVTEVLPLRDTVPLPVEKVEVAPD